MKHRPLFAWIFCTRIDPPRAVGKSGLVVPDKARDKFPYAFARVLDIGPEVLTVKVGDVIAYPKSRGELLPQNPNDPLDSECILILNEKEVLSIVEDFVVETSVLGFDGSFLTLDPQSLALPDAVYKNRDDVEVAQHYSIPGIERYVDEHPPGDADDDA